MAASSTHLPRPRPDRDCTAPASGHDTMRCLLVTDTDTDTNTGHVHDDVRLLVAATPGRAARFSVMCVAASSIDTDGSDLRRDLQAETHELWTVVATAEIGLLAVEGELAARGGDFVAVSRSPVTRARRLPRLLSDRGREHPGAVAALPPALVL